MCGIAGFWQPGGGRAEELAAQAGVMARRLSHRGPDDGGSWADAPAGVALGFARLAIQDLSPCGHQPMLSASGRYALTFNGEVYNFGELRRELEGFGHAFRGHSDTEVMLAAFEEWGPGLAVERFVGMFAFALWDRRERRLFLVRDRLGIKPLYYGVQGGVLLWGSELKALRAHPRFEGEIDRDALALFLRHNAVPAPYSIYRGIAKLPPGTILSLDEPGAPARPCSYWSAVEVVRRGARQPFTGSEAQAAERLESLLRDAVRLRMIADVPLGALLSGGIDSSLVAALMQELSPRPVKTFSIGFREAAYDEAPHAAKVAAHLGSEHHELYVTPREALEVIALLPTIYDEPFSDASQIPTYLVCRLTRRHVVVCLTGDGGDELFAGYSRYFTAHRIWRKIGWMPPGTRRLLGGMLRAAGGRGRVWGEIAAMESGEALYRRLTSHWKEPAEVVIGAREPATAASLLARRGGFGDLFAHMGAADMASYLHDDILTKVDRASMAVALEARVPLLDHRVAEFAASLPRSFKVRGGRGKWLLRRLLARRVPPALTERPKMGFGVPIDEWLRGPLRPWAEELLSEARLHREGWFHPGPIRQKWEEHLSGRRDWQYYLWDILMAQAWLEARTRRES